MKHYLEEKYHYVSANVFWSLWLLNFIFAIKNLPSLVYKLLIVFILVYPMIVIFLLIFGLIKIFYTAKKKYIALGIVINILSAISSAIMLYGLWIFLSR